MVFRGVKLPDQLKIALEEGRLVVFASAGISVPEPFGLPSFNDLVHGLAAQKHRIEFYTHLEAFLRKHL